MFYGYKATPQDPILLPEVSDVVAGFTEKHGEGAYVEYPGPFGGVTVRKITRYSEKHIRELTKALDKAYQRIVKPKEKNGW